MFRLIIFLILFFLPACLFSQTNYIFQHLTVEDGLVCNPRVQTFQDRKGYYWFSYLSGIQRFDGKNFISFLYTDNATKNRSIEWVGKPVEDKEGNIWILNEDGINIYNRNQQRLTRLYMPDAADSNINNTCCIIKDKEEKIYIITDQKLYQYDYVSKKKLLISTIINNTHSSISYASYNAEKNIFWLLISKKGNFEIATFDYLNKKINYTKNNALEKILSSYKPVSLFKLDENNNLWISDYAGNLCKYNTITNTVTDYSFLHAQEKNKKAYTNYIIHDMLDEGNGTTIWFGGENTGILKYNTLTGLFTTIKFDNSSEYGLHYDQTIYSLFKDHEGNIWADTDLGMNIFNPGLQKFKYIDQNATLIQQSKPNVTGIFESSNKGIWISTWGNGIFKYDSNFVFQSNYIHKEKDAASLGEPFNRIWTLEEDDKKRIWAGSQYAMVSILTPSTGKFNNNIIPEFQHYTIMHITKDKSHNLWFGLYNGMLGKWNSVSNKISVYNNLYGEDCKNPTVIDGLFVDEKNLLYVATNEYGLTRFNEDKKIMDEKNLFPQHIMSPGSLNDSVIMGGTSGKGFFLFNKIRKTTRFFNTSNGLSSNIVFGALSKNPDDIWIFTSNGINRLNLPDGKIVHYDLNDGVKDHVILRAFCKLKNGLFLVAANSGIIYFNPDSITTKPPPPNVMITAFSAGSQPMTVDSLLQNQNINLHYNQNIITIEYASVSFTGRSKDQYFYQLKGIDPNWISAGTHRSVTYANLASGNYIFNVKSQNAEGIETQHITSLHFTIHPPWWKSWWAYCLWFMLTASLFYGVYMYRKRNRQALANVRQVIAADLHDDIGSTLNSISVYSQIAGGQLKTDTENAKILLDKMGTASRNMIDTMNDIVWAVNPENDYFENILQRMKYFAGELLSGKNILLQFSVDDSVKNLKLPMEKRKNFYLIFKEAINNTYKYAGGKTVNVSIEQKAKNIVMIISDDGAGFETLKKIAIGNGLKNMQARAKEINAQLSIISWPAQGTRIELRMPV